MLLNFEFKNFRSFKDMTNLTMKASSQTTFNDKLIRSGEKRILPSAVIYGANASGKSNVILALSCFRDIVMCANLSSDHLYGLELYPFVHDEEHNPIHFGIDFINRENRFKYELEILTNKLTPGKRKVVYERLSRVTKQGDAVPLFERRENDVIVSTNRRALRYMRTQKGFIDSIAKKLNDNLDETTLFLTGGFKSVISGEIADIVMEFFSEKLIVIDNFTIGEVEVCISKNPPDTSYAVWNQLLDVFVRAADFGPQTIYFRHDKQDDEPKCRLYSNYQINKTTNAIIPSDLMESQGTLKLIDFAILFQKVFKSGGTLVMDEFDNALHSEIVKGILSLFSDPQLNTNGAQLIFTTHNPIYLNNKIFRRDQIIFIDKDPSSYRSTLYTLADFGSEEVRNDENYLINYFKGKYSSMPYIDFSLLIKENAEKAEKATDS